MSVKSEPEKLKCPQCKNTEDFQSERDKHRCCACGKFFSARVEITTTTHRNRVFNGPFGTR